MSCPLCGDQCRCAYEIRQITNRPFQPRFEAEVVETGIVSVAAALIDPEADGASEQRFAAGLEESAAAVLHPRFEVETEEDAPALASAAVEGEAGEEIVSAQGSLPNPVLAENRIVLAEVEEKPIDEPVRQEFRPEETNAIDPSQVNLLHNPASWRQEVAARVHSYRTRRRPHGPRYPSLRLKFEAGEPGWPAPCGARAPTAPTRPLSTRPTAKAVAVDRISNAPSISREAKLNAPAAPIEPAEAAPLETGARIIQFRGSAGIAPVPLYELAEPLLHRPRILEAPEVTPPPPAMGGIVIEPAEEPANQKRPGIDVPLQSAPLARRVLAATIDAVFVLIALVAFASIFVKMTALAPPLQLTAVAALAFTWLFWAAYQYLLLVYAGATPGLRLAKLQLSRFDGTPTSRALRRWRVLVSLLSGLSLGLGYAWCFLDEDALCWHDRITRTYLAPKSMILAGALAASPDDMPHQR